MRRRGITHVSFGCASKAVAATTAGYTPSSSTTTTVFITNRGYRSSRSRSSGSVSVVVASGGCAGGGGASHDSHHHHFSSPLKIAMRFQSGSASVAAAATNSSSSSSSNQQQQQQQPSVPRELQFSFESFAESAADLHWELLVEAHRKHGVWLSVPPQAPPSVPHVGPPAIPAVIIPAAQAVRMATMTLAYPPTNAPPPLRTTGSRALRVADSGSNSSDGGMNVDSLVVAMSAQQQMWRQGAADLPPQERQLMEQVQLATLTAHANAQQQQRRQHSSVPVSAAAMPLPSSSSSWSSSSLDDGSAAAVPGIQTVLKRAAVDPTMKYHCSQCGKAFRKIGSATAHVDAIHKSVSGGGVTGENEKRNGAKEAAAASRVLAPAPLARVLEGAGPGEITGSEEVVVFSSSPAATAVKPKTAQAQAPTPMAPSTADDNTTNTATTATAAAGDTPTPTPTTAAASGLTKVKKSYESAVVTLPDDDAVEALLLGTWDAVALGRDDIAKPADLPIDPTDPKKVIVSQSMSDPSTISSYHQSSGGQQQQRKWDSCGGKFFIPAALVVEGKADRRKELEALTASRPLARATPEGAAPGIKRHPVVATSGISSSSAAFTGLTSVRGGGGANASVNYRAMRELVKQYPNPFGADAQSAAALLLELEREPVNPFIDLEGQTRTSAVTTTINGNASSGIHGGVRNRTNSSGGGGDTMDTRKVSGEREDEEGEDESGGGGGDGSAGVSVTDTEGKARLLSALLARPFACPVCAASASSSLSSSSSVSVSSAATMPRESLCSLAAAADFTAACPYRFRLLDGLLDHVETCHNSNKSVSNADAASSFSSLNSSALLVDGELTRAALSALYATGSNTLAAAAAELTDITARVAAAAAVRDSHGNAANATATGGVGGDATDDSGISGNGIANGGSGYGSGDATSGGGDGTGGSGGGGGLIPSVPVERVAVHARAAVNTVLVGTVRDIQDGYLHDAPVLQLVIAVRHTRRSKNANNSNSNGSDGGDFKTETTSGSGSGSGDGSGDGDGDDALATAADSNHDQQHQLEEVEEEAEEEKQEEEEDELIVVRCVGGNDLVPRSLLRQRLHINSRVYVEGLLRLNRHVDAASKRSHAYPFVQVVPPFGSVRAL